MCSKSQRRSKPMYTHIMFPLLELSLQSSWQDFSLSLHLLAPFMTLALLQLLPARQMGAFCVCPEAFFPLSPLQSTTPRFLFLPSVPCLAPHTPLTPLQLHPAWKMEVPCICPETFFPLSPPQTTTPRVLFLPSLTHSPCPSFT